MTCMTGSTGYKLPEMPEPSGKAYQQAVEVLLPYLLSHRSRLASFDADVVWPLPMRTSSLLLYEWR